MAAGKERGPSEARALMCWLVREEKHLSLTDLSKRFKRDISGLSIAASRLVEKARRDRVLAAKMTQLKADLLQISKSQACPLVPDGDLLASVTSNLTFANYWEQVKKWF